MTCQIPTQEVGTQSTKKKKLSECTTTKNLGIHFTAQGFRSHNDFI